MKKIFTMIAAAFMAVSAQAQTLTFEEAIEAGSANELTLGDDDFKVVLTGGAKAKVEAKSLTFAVDETSTPEKFDFQWSPGGAIAKLTGERSVTITVSKAGALTLYPRSSGSDDRDFKVVQNDVTLLNGTAYNGQKVTIGDKSYYKAYQVDVAAGTINITAESAINLSAFKFVPSGDTPTPQPSGDEVIASYDNGTKTGEWSVYNNAEQIEEKNYALLDFSTKYNEKKTNCTAITLPSSFDKKVDDVTIITSYVKVAGDFKAGDVVTIWPFTQMGESDKATKYANIRLYADEAGTLIKDMTGSASGALTVTNNDEAGEPKSFSHTLENDLSMLVFGRQGGTRINLLKVTVTRGGTAGIQTVKTQNAADGIIYNLAGQKVGKDYKGVVIMNGKKVVLK